MAHTRNYLALDLGAESGRAILGQFDGSRIQLTPVHRFPNLPAQLPDGWHWDVLRLWNEIKEGIAQASRKHNVPLDGIGLDTWGVDFALLDRQGGLIGEPFHYRDSRTDTMQAAAFARVTREEIFNQTGIQFMQLNSLYQLLAMVLNQSPALEIARTFLMIPDLFNYWLSGRQVCEFSDATTTQLYDPCRRAWATPLMEAMGIPAQIFPQIVPSATVLGPLLPALADQLGVSQIPVIAPACHDTGSAVVAVPAESQDFVWLSSGTWSIMGTELANPVINAASLRHNFTNEGGACDTFRFCKNITGLWIVQECRRTWAARGDERSYGELTEMAAQAAPLAAVIDPDAIDFLKPGDMPSRVRDYCRRTGQPVPDDQGAVLRCVLESLALKYRYVVDSMEQVMAQDGAHSGHRDTIHIVGGGTQNQLLSQLTADASGRRVVAGPVEATATGNMLAQALALGDIGSLAEARAIVRNSFDVMTYEPHPSQAWDDAYGRLTELAQNAG